MRMSLGAWVLIFLVVALGVYIGLWLAVHVR